MLFTKLFTLAALALAPLVSAQAPIELTDVPGPFTIGQPATIKWSGGNGDSVTLILRQGTDTNDLQTISIIASNVQGNSYTWTPASTIQPADDYQLQIEQGLNSIGYSGLFSIQSAAEGAASTIFVAGGSTTRAIATFTPSANSTTGSMSMTSMSSGMSMMLNGTGTGTGAAMPRNTTMVSPTLSAAATTTTAAVTTTATATTTSTHPNAAAIARTSGGAVLGLGVFAAAAVYLL